MPIGKLLLLTDGEAHTARAEDYALTLAAALSAELVALYVVDPFLQRFTHEIYAVNRDACRAHLNQALAAEGETGLAQFSGKAASAGVAIQTRIRYGPPEQVVTDEVATRGYDLVILGAKHLEGWRQRFESFNLPARILRSVECSLLVVK